jgi:Sensors of blue-light using FAD
MGASNDGLADLVSLVYVSSSVRKLDRAEILEILRTSQRNNQQRDVTGMLLYKDGNFMQVLEGPEPALVKLMETVERDNRHRGVIVLTKRPIQERQFPNWSMAFRDLGDLSEEDKEAFSPFLAGSLLDGEFRRKPDQAYKLLLRFKDNVR